VGRDDRRAGRGRAGVRARGPGRRRLGGRRPLRLGGHRGGVRRRASRLAFAARFRHQGLGLLQGGGRARRRRRGDARRRLPAERARRPRAVEPAGELRRAPPARSVRDLALDDDHPGVRPPRPALRARPSRRAGRFRGQAGRHGQHGRLGHGPRPRRRARPRRAGRGGPSRAVGAAPAALRDHARHERDAVLADVRDGPRLSGGGGAAHVLPAHGGRARRSGASTTSGAGFSASGSAATSGGRCRSAGRS
jgi:hypothetical protein